MYILISAFSFAASAIIVRKLVSFLAGMNIFLVLPISLLVSFR